MSKYSINEFAITVCAHCYPADSFYKSFPLFRSLNLPLSHGICSEHKSEMLAMAKAQAVVEQAKTNAGVNNNLKSGGLCNLKIGEMVNLVYGDGWVLEGCVSDVQANYLVINFHKDRSYMELSPFSDVYLTRYAGTKEQPHILRAYGA